MLPWHAGSGSIELAGRREEFLTHESLKYRRHSWSFPLLAVLSAFKLHNDFNSWFGILRVDDGFRGRRGNQMVHPTVSTWGVGCYATVLGGFGFSHGISQAVVVFLFLWWKVKRAVRPFSLHTFDSWYFKLLKFTHYTLGDCSSKMAPNGSHLLVFMSLGSLLPVNQGWGLMWITKRWRWVTSKARS